MSNVKQEAMDEWLEHPVTKVFREFLHRESEAYRGIAAIGGCRIHEKDSGIIDYERTGRQYSNRILVAEIYEALYNVSLEDMLPEETNDD